MDESSVESDTSSSTLQQGVHVGKQPDGFQSPWKVKKVFYHGFVDLSREEYAPTTSPEFDCCGNQWKLSIYPGGWNDGDLMEREVSLLLESKTKNVTVVDVFFSVSDPVDRREVVRSEAVRHQFRHDGQILPEDERKDSLMVVHFADILTLSRLLQQGTLEVEVWMRLPGGTASPREYFTLPNPMPRNVFAAFWCPGSGPPGDIIIEVGGEQGDGEDSEEGSSDEEESCDEEEDLDINNESIGLGSSRSHVTYDQVGEAGEEACNRAKTSMTKFHVHRFILDCCAPVLAKVCKSTGEGVTSVTIADVKPKIFEQVLRYVYGQHVDELCMKENTKDIIETADKFGLLALKLEAEMFYVNSTTFTTENAIDNFLYAQAQNCEFLKQAVMDFLLENAAAALDKVCFSNVPNSAIQDVLAAMARRKRKGDGDNIRPVNYDALGVGALRRIMHMQHYSAEYQYYTRHEMAKLFKNQQARATAFVAGLGKNQSENS